jgi:membrane-bound lytic murein transglycosylase B
MGPMQFLPATWETSSVDGNGVANMMDPEDAIPATAGYLRDRGTSHGWYVKKVLAVDKAYRRLAHDESVGPYV